MLNSKSKEMPDYIHPSKIRLSLEKKAVESHVTISSPSDLIPSITPNKSVVMMAMKNNRKYFSGAMLNTEDDQDEGNEYPGMNVSRRSERFGSTSATSLVYPLRKTPSTRSQSDAETPSNLSCFDRLFMHFIMPCQPKKAFYYAAEGVRNYMDALDQAWSPILEMFEWPKLPGGQHKKTRGFNYVTHSIWILAYAAGTSSGDDNGKEEFYRECFENMILQGEMVGILLQDFVKPVNELEQMLQPFDEMATSMDIKLMTPAYFGVDAGEIFDESIIPDSRRYKMRDYVKLKIYTRDVQDMEWVEFHDLRFRDQMTRIQNGITDIVAKLKIILSTMPSVLKVIKGASGRRRGLPVLLPHMIRMRNSLKALYRSAKTSTDDHRVFRSVFMKAQQNVQKAIEQAIFSMINIWEVILMTRLAYKYVSTSSMSSGNMVALEDVLKRLSNHDKRLSPDVDYKWKQFYDVNCAALLRKAPVFIRNSVEMAIHLDGFSNPETQAQPAKKSLAPFPRQSKQIQAPLLPIKELIKPTAALSVLKTTQKAKVQING